jgi:lipopolysaccharide transport protein LptA
VPCLVVQSLKASFSVRSMSAPPMTASNELISTEPNPALVSKVRTRLASANANGPGAVGSGASTGCRNGNAAWSGTFIHGFSLRVRQQTKTSGPPGFSYVWCRQRHRGCRNRVIERRLNAVRECSAPQSRDFPLRIADYCLAAMLVLGMPGAAAAQNQVQGALPGQNNGQPIHIEAMTLEIRDKDKTATFSGNVKVLQGDTTMRCRTLVVFYGPEEGTGATKPAAAPTSTESQAAPAMPQGGNIRRAEARGDVTVVSKDQNASGDLGVYDTKA